MRAASVASPQRSASALRQMGWFVAIGTGAALSFIALSQAIIGRVGPVPDWLASALLYAAMILPVYLLHRRFSFDSAAPHGQALPRYIALQSALVGLSALFSFVAYSLLGLATPLAALIVIVATSAVSFVLARAWVFGDGVDAKALLNAVHDKAVFGRRVNVLARELAAQLPQGARVLDLGAGDGSVALALMGLRPDVTVEGVDVMLRPRTMIPVHLFDGKTLPFADKSFDAVTIVDVLHHTEDPATVMAEAARVARQAVIIKDHTLDGFLAGPTLRFMDWVGNRGHDVVLPYNYLSPQQWQAALGRAGLVEQQRVGRIGLYPAPFAWLFDRNLHFVGRFRPA